MYLPLSYLGHCRFKSLRQLLKLDLRLVPKRNSILIVHHADALSTQFHASTNVTHKVELDIPVGEEGGRFELVGAYVGYVHLLVNPTGGAELGAFQDQPLTVKGHGPELAFGCSHAAESSSANGTVVSSSTGMLYFFKRLSFLATRQNLSGWVS